MPCVARWTKLTALLATLSKSCPFCLLPQALPLTRLPPMMRRYVGVCCSIGQAGMGTLLLSRLLRLVGGSIDFEDVRLPRPNIFGRAKWMAQIKVDMQAVVAWRQNFKIGK